MDCQRHTGQPGCPDVCSEVELLHVSWRPIVEVIQARLAYPDDPRMLRQRGDLLESRYGPLRRMMRMHTHRAPNVLRCLDECQQSARLRHRCADGDHLA